MRFHTFINPIKYFFSTYKFSLLGALLIVASVFFISKLLEKSDLDNTSGSFPEIVDCDRSLYATAPITAQRIMNDKNDIQNLHAQVNGLKQIYISNASFEADSAKLASEHVLVKLKNNRLYHVKELTHSYPYATPEMADLLNTLGNHFYQKLKAKNLGYYRFLVTSALRTNETQQDLTSRNRNASTQSAHLYGATIDITYKEFYNVHTGALEQNYLVADALRVAAARRKTGQLEQLQQLGPLDRCLFEAADRTPRTKELVSRLRRQTGRLGGDLPGQRRQAVVERGDWTDSHALAAGDTEFFGLGLRPVSVQMNQAARTDRRAAPATDAKGLVNRNQLHRLHILIV